METADRIIELTCGEAGERLDSWLANKLEGFSRSNVQKLIMDGRVLVDGGPAGKNHKIRAGERVKCEIPRIAPPDVSGQDIKLDIVYEDSHIIVINKPRGMVVHPGNGNPDGTLVNALVFHCADGLSDAGGIYRPGIVHRLDKDTSGLIVAAKTNEAHYKLAAQFKDRRVRKIYDAIVCGHVIQNLGRIELPIGRHKSDRKRMAVDESGSGGREAVTLFKVVARLPCARTWLELELITGRTHQIRVHLAHIGYPVAGDPIYGRGNRGSGCPGLDVCGFKFAENAQGVPGACPLENGAGGLLLHAALLEFDHPATGERLRFQSGLPAYFPVIG